jgi:glutathione S-transferase
MKLYFTPGACSLSPHIVAREARLALELEKVDGTNKTTASGRDYWAINPKGYVPALELDDGQLLTEGPAIVQYLADAAAGNTESQLIPPAGTVARYRVQEMLGYINSELHKTYSPLFNPKTSAETREERVAYLLKRYAFIEKTLSKSQFLCGDSFTVADAYLFTVTNWAGHVKVDLSAFPNLLAFQKRVGARPQVQEALRAEGLLKA